MIKIEAFVREDKFEDVKEALAKIKFMGLQFIKLWGVEFKKAIVK